MGWAKTNLSVPERAAIARGLFEVDDNFSNESWLRGLCPIHSEQNSSFGYNLDDDYFNCLACDATGDLIDLFGKVNGYDKETGFKEFTKRFGKGVAPRRDRDQAPGKTKKAAAPKPKPVKESPVIDEAVWQKMEPLPEDWQKRLLEVRGWTAKTLADLDVRLQTIYRAKKDGKIKEIKTPERVAIPIRDPEGRLRNIRLYKPGAKEYKIISWGTDYGRARLFPAVPAAGQTILLCEGEPDTICALAHGFNAITQTSKTRNWDADHLAPFHNRDVVVCYDADQAGQKHAENALKALAPVAASVRRLEWPDFMGRTPDGDWPKDHGQDLTDYFVNHKKAAEDLRDLIARAQVYELPDDELENSANSSSERQFFTKGINGRVSFKPRLLADRIMQDQALLSDPETGVLYRWNGIHWEEYSVDNVSAACLRYLGIEADKSRAENVVYQVKRLSTIPHGRKVNDLVDWACLQNGMLNLTTLELKPHAQDFYSTNVLGVSFNPNSGKTCSRWLKFLQETIQDPDSIKQFQEFAGYCLTRDVKYGKCLLLIGDGSDGKSTALKIIRQLVGKQNCSSVGFEELDDQFHRSALKDKLLNIATEVGSKALESNLLKALVTGDEVRAAFKHKDGFNLESYCKFAFSANRLPRVLDNSDGFFRRLLIIKFKRQFMGEDDDTNLIETLQAELSEIFSWALVGLHRLMEQNRFTTSAESLEIMQEYRRLNNPVQCFVEDYCAIEAESYVTKDTLYNKYREYIGKYGYMPQNYENFFRELRSAVKNLSNYRQRVPGGGRQQSLRGIRLVEV